MALSHSRRPYRNTQVTVWHCRCDCGNEITAYTGNLLRGRTKSCGCWQDESRQIQSVTHGKSHTPEWYIWVHMRERCKGTWQKNYGGRGITVCERWQHSFAAFLADMGPRPSPLHEIERKDNDGPYSPENCTWATCVEQANNKRNNHRLTWNNKTQTIAQWSRETGIPAYLIQERIVKRQWAIHKALSTPPRKIRHTSSKCLSYKLKSD
jgi:hypothetical protein